MAKIYYDMDNTIALFSIKGEEENALERMFEKGYFRNLPIFPETMETLSSLMWEGHQVFILSACIDSSYCKSEKLEWIGHYLPFIPKENIILCKVGQNKAKIIGDVTGSYLIDDYSKNLKQWEQAGGIAIKKRSSSKNGYRYIIRKHSEIFDILAE